MFWKTVKKLASKVISTVLHTGNNVLTYIGVDTAALGALVLDMDKDTKGIYHASFDCWQQYFGYNNLYDLVFELGTSMQYKKFPFTYKKVQYIFWAWKGDYINLGAGAELGIYYGEEPIWKVDKSLAMNMSLRLRYKGSSIIIYNEKTWWITGFNPDYKNVLASDLKVTYKITFKTKAMFYAFIAKKYSGWSYDDKYMIATYTF